MLFRSSVPPRQNQSATLIVHEHKFLFRFFITDQSFLQSFLQSKTDFVLIFRFILRFCYIQQILREFGIVYSVALYHTICTCTLRTYIYICYMAYRTLDPRYTLLYIPIRVLYHTKLQTLFTISSHHCNLAC